jgi:hypothetical protein
VASRPGPAFTRESRIDGPARLPKSPEEVPQQLLLFLRIVLVLVALGLLGFLLWRGGLNPQLRVVLIAALVFYAVRLWLTASRMRRDRQHRAVTPPEE